MELLESAEFWNSMAFVLVIIVSVSPLHSLLRKWGKRQGEAILSAEQEAKTLYNKAKNLKETYEQNFLNREKDHKKIEQETNQKIAFLEQEIQTKTQEKIRHKKQEVDLRIRNIQENEQQAIKIKLLSRVITQAQENLQQAPPTENKDTLVDDICSSLDEFQSALH